VKLLNFYLSALSKDDASALMPSMSEVAFSSGAIIYRPGDLVDAVYFPGSACLSVITTMEDGTSVESATVGRESAIGLLDAATGSRSVSQVLAQIPGSGHLLPAAAFRARLAQSPTLLDLTLRHARAIAVQSEQGVACNVTHSVHGRLARWLLMTQDRVGSSTFPLTQEYMAVMTGVQRSTVSVMASALKKAGVINYNRGQVTIRDREALLKHACECYGVVRDQFEALRSVATD